MSAHRKAGCWRLGGLLASLLLAGCSMPDDDQRRVNLGLPPAGFTPDLQQGMALYLRNCASCHGRAVEGTPRGPALIHQVYRPDHHADLAFFMAIKQGVRQHHWQFGDMPAQPQLSAEQAGHIVAWLRQRQGKGGDT